MYISLIGVLSWLLFFNGVQSDKRPIYNIGHMTNSIDEIKQLLDMGANALETDVTFLEDGKLNGTYHGTPCDCDRYCEYSANLPDYLDYIREITNPNTKENYYNQFTFLFFDLKLDRLNADAKKQAGIEIADAVLDHLWAHDESREKMKVLMYFNKVTNNGALSTFLERFKRRGVESLLQNVGFDGGLDDIDDIRAMFESFEINDRIWIGDGNINCLSVTYPDERLKKEIAVRDMKDGYISKVYHWTIDDENRIRKSLNLEVDGFITNRPDILNKILDDETFTQKMRLATLKDDPFAKFLKQYTNEDLESGTCTRSE